MSRARDLLDEAYRTHLSLPPEWTDQQKEDYLDREATRLERLYNQVQADLQDTYLREWKARYDKIPDFLTHAGLVRNSQIEAWNVVLDQEVWSLIEPDEDEEEWMHEETNEEHYQRKLAELYHDPDRWKTPWVETLAEARALAETLWPDEDQEFHFLMGEYLTVRTDQQRMVPMSADEPLAIQMAQEVREFAPERRRMLDEQIAKGRARRANQA
ncbi:hypothetical protein [Lolliginicoccus levis]|uniref:hypothetical protein n=1 Tax=Lolliginicoccus levis TaxID=2919542 RepID=UPI00241D0B6F|nr:hypothetical protein [Lolliginicoccus levis]